MPRSRRGPGAWLPMNRGWPLLARASAAMFEVRAIAWVKIPPTFLARHVGVHAILSLESRPSQEIVTVVEKYFAPLLGQVLAIKIKPAKIADQVLISFLVICLVRP